MHKGLTAIIMSLALSGSLVVAGCSGQPLTTREEGTIGGTAIGAGAGAIVGAAVESSARGRRDRRVMGGGTGYVVGNSMQNQENANAQTQEQVQQQQQEIEKQHQQLQQMKSESETE